MAPPMGELASVSETERVIKKGEKMTSKYGIEIPEGSHYTVYKFTDPEGKVYIGCTGIGVKKRWKNGWNYRRCLPIGRAIERYGWDAFDKKILCDNLTKEGAEKLEAWFVDYYDSTNDKKGYNGVTGGARKGAKMSESSKALNSATNKKLFAEHPEMREINRRNANIGWSDPDYVELNRKLRKQMYREQPERRKAISDFMKEYLSHPENRAFTECDRRARPVMCIETGECYPSQSAAERASGFYNVHKACSGRFKTCGGLHWRYLTEEEKGRFYPAGRTG